MRTKILVGQASIGFVATLLGCGGDDDDTAEPTDDTDKTEESTTTEAASSESTTTTLDPNSPQGQAIATYLDAREFMREQLAVNPPQPPRQEIENYFSGVALKDSLETLGRKLTENVYLEAEGTENPQVETASDSEVLLKDCVTSDEKIFDAATGAEKDTISEVHHLTVRVKKLDVGWRVDEITVGEAECQP